MSSYLLTDNEPFDIAVLMATRGRTKSLSLAITSLISKATNKNKIEIILGFDRDDLVGIGYFNEVISHWLDTNNISYKIVITERYGYGQINKYYNLLGNIAQANWLIAYNDDTIMETQGWDQFITKFNGKFKVLSVITHNEHPYSIFPIVPKIWVNILGRLSRHQLFDAEISQMAYLLDIFERIPVYVLHDRVDLTGNNNDSTSAQRIMHEGNLNDPEDFNHENFAKKRIYDTNRVAQYMKHIGLDTSWWESAKNGENKKPFAKLEANDPNKQVNTNIPRR